MNCIQHERAQESKAIKVALAKHQQATGNAKLVYDAALDGLPPFIRITYDIVDVFQTREQRPDNEKKRLLLIASSSRPGIARPRKSKLNASANAE